MNHPQKKAMGKKHTDNILPTDFEALKQAHQFVRDDETDEQHCDDWKVRMARRYYNKLYKEYAVIDLSRYTEGRYGLRWRTEKEVIKKKGQSVCASKQCEVENNLGTYEVLFKYSEDSKTKRELVKVCLCEGCAEKLKVINSARKDVSAIESMPEGSSRKRQRI